MLDIEGPDKKGIAFIIPHKTSDLHLLDYAMTIDEAEAKLGLNFYPELMTSAVESEIESQLDLSSWSVDAKRFKRRVNDWNHQ